ncbi:hypothetical protein B0T22DRAFT_506431 [Podospora appendiculata]|uniref:Glycosyltransferase Family 32 n=1 Tax=Podospora appendiculata TaxID=314037 RepID=A0AAE0XJ06_9PEZI|nr:hypothetical protein B0T22DRAFT_506431 [Podospora appendiculata]
MLIPHARRPTSNVAITIASVALTATGFLLYHTWSDTDSWSLAKPLPVLTTSDGIPKKIWYKLGPKGLTNATRAWTNTCIDGNPGYAHEFMTDESGDAYVAARFASRPDIVASYLGLTIPILKADLLRYLLLVADGGVWSDLDVSCAGVPMDAWVPAAHRADAGLVVGWEFDVGWGENIIRQFTSWLIMARPNSPHLWAVVEDIVQGIQDKTAEHNVTVAGLQLAMVGEVVDFTGPRRLTRGVLKSLARSLNVTAIDQANITHLVEPKLLGDVLILPGFAFAASANTYDEKLRAGLGPPLVKHHYAGTWKNKNGGEVAG